MTTYTITVTDKQLQIMSEACEVLSRLGLGQFRDALEYLPLTPFPAWHDDLLKIGKLLSVHTKHNVDGWQTHLSISSPDVKEDCRIAFDLYQVFRHRLSWDKIDKTADPSDWSLTAGRSFDKPYPFSKEHLAKINSITE